MNFSVNPNLRKQVDQALKAIAWALLPPRCVLCRQPGMYHCDLCQSCFDEMPRNQQACHRCAEPLPHAAALCVRCQTQMPRFHSVIAPLRYEYPLNVLVPRFKFHQDLAAGRVLAETFLRHIPDTDLPQALVPVPLHLSRLRQRGFDQALELARTLSSYTQIPLCGHALKRVRATRAQSDLDAKARQNNCRDAFVLKTKPSYSHVALVDDVMTTGATATACAEVLIASGIERVDVWAMARVATK